MMRCPTVNDLPPPPAGKKGWPWSVESTPLSDSIADRQEWPRITIITPSFNQGQFIEETIRSVLLQGYPNVEYIVIDGGSTDNSVEIIKKYSRWLAYWVSEPDKGQSDAINRGLRMGTGLFANWINSDDMLCKNALVEHVTRVGFDINTVYLGNCLYVDIRGQVVRSHRGRVFSFEDLVRIPQVWRAGGHIVQPEVLFPRELALAVGGLNTENHSSMDFELWGMLLLNRAHLRYTDIPFGIFRLHEEQKTNDGLKQTHSLIATATKLISLAQCFSQSSREMLVSELNQYLIAYENNYWKGTGRLAWVGLPPQIVNPIRNFRRKLARYKSPIA